MKLHTETLHTDNRITIEAPPSLIYRLAADVSRWPDILSHYRYVHVLEDSGDAVSPRRRVVKMAASRSGLPVSWTSIQELDPEERLIRYWHIRGVTKGMIVVWRIQPAGRGALVSIDHHLAPTRWWLRSRPASYILGRVFIMHIAGKTLEGIKRRAESRGSRPPAP